jgi:hypothetical protein
MAVMVPRETVTEHRLDALEKKVDEGFKQVDEGFAKVDARFERMDARFGQMNDRFDRMQHTLLGGAIAIIVALIGSTATLAGIALF